MKTEKTMTKETIDKIFTVKKQLNIQKVIDQLYKSHNIPTTESKKMHILGRKVLQQLNSNNYNEKDFLTFLEMAKKQQSFEPKENELPPLLDDTDESNPSDVKNDDAQNEEKVDNIKEETNE